MSHLQVLFNGKPVLSETVGEFHMDHGTSGHIIIKATQQTRKSAPMGIDGPTGAFLDGLVTVVDKKPAVDVLSLFRDALKTCTPRPVGFPIASRT
jgi:hypothetical protein